MKIKPDLIILKNTTKNNSIFRQSTSSETDNIRTLTGFQGCRFVHLYQPHSLCLSYLKPSPSSMEETTNWALALELLLMSLIFSLQIGMQNSSLSLSKFFFVELSYLIPFKLFFLGGLIMMDTLQAWISKEETIWPKIKCNFLTIKMMKEVNFFFCRKSIKFMLNSCYSLVQKKLLIVSLMHWSIMINLVKIMGLRSCIG